KLNQVSTWSPSASSRVAASRWRISPSVIVTPPVELEDEELLELDEDELLVLDVLLVLDDVEAVPGGGELPPSRLPRQPRLASQPTIEMVVQATRTKLSQFLTEREVSCFTCFSRCSPADWVVAMCWQL